MLKAICSVLISVVLLVSSAFADSLYGTVKYKDGSKDKGTNRISTSWNGKTASSNSSGKYRLDFGGKVGKKITVYVNGKTYTEIKVDGDTQLNITVP